MRNILVLVCFCILFFSLFSPSQAQGNTAGSGVSSAEFQNALASSQITAAHAGQDIAFRGQIRRVIPSLGTDNPVRLVLEQNGSETLEVVFDKELASVILPSRRYPSAGTEIAVRGRLTEDAHGMSLRVVDPAQILIRELAPAQTPSAGPSSAFEDYATVADIPRLKTERIDKLVSIRGVVYDYRSSWSPSAPNIVYLNDGTNEVELVYWNADGGGENLPNFSQVGTPVFATGLLQYYRERLQIKILDLAMISTTPLPRDFLARNLKDAEAIANRTPAARNSATRSPSKIEWMEYSPLRAQQKLDEDGYVIIYVRSESIGLCKEFENGYLLHPDAIAFLAPRTVFFINVSTDTGVQFAKQLKVDRVPGMLVYRKGQERTGFLFTSTTTPQQVYEFYQSLP